MTDYIYYAIGDVHGELGKLERLVEFVREDAERMGVDRRFILLGDLIDRGPDSRGVVERAMRLEVQEGARTLRGNHEEMLLNALDSPDQEGMWLLNGGESSLSSYERVNGRHSDWRRSVDIEHVRWMRRLPTLIRDEQRKLAFVHAGIDPRTFPDCADGVRVWTRSAAFFASEAWPEREVLSHTLVVHGHTPTENFEPEVERRRINIDTGACFGGPLTCVVLAPGEEPRFLRAA